MIKNKHVSRFNQKTLKIIKFSTSRREVYNTPDTGISRLLYTHTHTWQIKSLPINKIRIWPMQTTLTFEARMMMPEKKGVQ